MNGPPAPSNARPSWTAGRAIILVDIQNLAGAHRLSATDVQRVRDAVTEIAAPRTQTVVACHHRNTATVAFGWRNARILSGTRPASQSLAETIEDEALAERFSHAILGSGDGTLAASASRLTAAGVRVTALVGNGALSARLRLACHEVTTLTDPPRDDVLEVATAVPSHGIRA